jgi:hypothetical protein
MFIFIKGDVMKKLVLAVAAIAMLAVGNVVARGCCPKERCEKPKHTTSCAPKPKCIKRCVVEKCVEPRKVCETVCHYECPPCDEVIEGAGEAHQAKSNRKYNKRMKMEAAE